jgi:hypothetical protein
LSNNFALLCKDGLGDWGKDGPGDCGKDGSGAWGKDGPHDDKRNNKLACP